MENYGLVVDPRYFSFKDFTFVAVPVPVLLEDNVAKIYYTARDKTNRSHTMSLLFDLEKMSPVNGSHQLELAPGSLGAFDDSGVMATSILNVNNEIWMYYIGWNLGTTVPFRNSIGLAKKLQGANTFVRFSEGPVLDRNRHEPYFCAGCDVRYNPHTFNFEMYYLRCTTWCSKVSNSGVSYHVRWTYSENGYDWVQPGKVALDYSNKNEYAISSPRHVQGTEGKTYCLYSSRADSESPNYRIRIVPMYNNSSAGQSPSTILIEDKGSHWCNQMVCYPGLIKYKDFYIVFYNGNAYGQTGIGAFRMEL